MASTHSEFIGPITALQGCIHGTTAAKYVQDHILFVMRKLVAAISGTYGERFLCHILLLIDRKYDKALLTAPAGCSIGTALMVSLSTQSWRAHS
jgi:hypothetical protein